MCNIIIQRNTLFLGKINEMKVMRSQIAPITDHHDNYEISSIDLVAPLGNNTISEIKRVAIEGIESNCGQILIGWSGTLRRVFQSMKTLKPNNSFAVPSFPLVVNVIDSFFLGYSIF